jgi:hypothetical protein
LNGVVHQGGASADLASAFIQGADDLSGAFFQPLLPGPTVPVPGQVGWLVIVAALVFAYRELEVWAMRWQPPTVDTSALGGGAPGIQQNSPPVAPGGGRSAEQCVHDKLVAELRFRLPAVEVRAPPIVPGGTMPNGLASIAEDSSMTYGGLAGAIIRVAGLLWPTPRRYRARVWIKLAQSPAAANSGSAAGQEPGRGGERRDHGEEHAVASMTVTIDIEDPQTSDLAALLCAKQERELINCPDDARRARRRQIDDLKNAVCNSPGVPARRRQSSRRA